MAGTGRPGVSRNAMPRRQRWTPVRGTGTRVASPAGRALLAAADLPLRRLGRAPALGGPPHRGARLLTGVVAVDETVSWIDQNRRAVAVAAGPEAIGGGAPVNLLTADDRARAKGVLAAQGLDGLRPLVGLHASGGRPIKQWAPARWREVAARLQRGLGAAFVLTGTAADRPLAAPGPRGPGGAV